jgi:hypothetical protein
MRWLYDLSRHPRSVRAPAAPRHGPRYRPRLDLLEGRGAPSSVFSDFTTSLQPSVVAPEQPVSLYVSMDEDVGVNNTGFLTAYVDWGDGTRPDVIRLSFVTPGLSPDYVYNDAADVDTHTYGPQDQGMTFAVVVTVTDGTNTGGGAAGSVTVVAAPGVPAASPTGDTTADFLPFALKSSFNSNSGTTKQPLLLLNASGQTIDGPFFVVLTGLKHSVKLANETGISKVLAPGDPYLYVPGGQLGPWQALSVTLDLHSSTGSRVSPTSFHTLVFSGTIVF